MKEQLTRDKIDSNDKWDLTLIYKNEDAFYKDLELAKKEIKKVTSFSDLLSSSKRLLEYIKYNEEIERLLYKLYYYSHLNFDSETINTKYQEMITNTSDLLNNYSELSSYIMPLFMEKDYSLIEKYMEEEPELKKYEFNFINMYRYKEHTLSDKEEKVLSTLSNTLTSASEIYESLTDSDMEYGYINDQDNKIKMTDSNYNTFIESSNRDLRKQAFDMMYDTYSKYKNTITKTYMGDIDAAINVAKLRNFKSARCASLFKDNVNESIYDNLIDTVNKNMDVIYKYFKLKKEILGLDEFHLYDVYAKLIDVENMNNYDFSEAKKIVIDALSVLGKDYITNLNKAFDEKWIDIYNNKGKRSGAYSSGFYDTKPYVLLNYEGKLNDISTLAHELGHSMHTYYSCSNQPYQYSNYNIFVAEVASTVNELLLSKYLLKTVKTKNEKLYILNRLMELFKGTIYRQTMFAEFERDIYKLREDGNALTNDILCSHYLDLNKKYFGDAVIVDDKIKYEWMRIPHFYYSFYVYKYATGLSCACYIVDGILNNKEGALDNYLKFLTLGGSMYPVDELKVAGVDINDSKVIESAINMFNDVIDEFKALYEE